MCIYNFHKFWEKMKMDEKENFQDMLQNSKDQCTKVSWLFQDP